jgi:hypothetical protein
LGGAEENAPDDVGVCRTVAEEPAHEEVGAVREELKQAGYAALVAMAEALDDAVERVSRRRVLELGHQRRCASGWVFQRRQVRPPAAEFFGVTHNTRPRPVCKTKLTKISIRGEIEPGGLIVLPAIEVRKNAKWRHYCTVVPGETVTDRCRATGCRQYTEDDFELYLMARLDAQAVRRMDEHLLLCGSCRETVEELDEFLRVLRLCLADTAEMTPELRRRGVGCFPCSRAAFS